MLFLVSGPFPMWLCSLSFRSALSLSGGPLTIIHVSENWVSGEQFSGFHSVRFADFSNFSYPNSWEIYGFFLEENLEKQNFLNKNNELIKKFLNFRISGSLATLYNFLEFWKIEILVQQRWKSINFEQNLNFWNFRIFSKKFFFLEKLKFHLEICQFLNFRYFHFVQIFFRSKMFQFKNGENLSVSKIFEILKKIVFPGKLPFFEFQIICFLALYFFPIKNFFCLKTVKIHQFPSILSRIWNLKNQKFFQKKKIFQNFEFLSGNC